VASFSDQQPLQWDVNSSTEDIRYSYRVEAECYQPNCNPDSDQECKVEVFGEESLGESVILNVIAKDIADLCQQLIDRGFDFPIKSVKKFSKPPFKRDQELLASSGVDMTCNYLSEVALGSEACAPLNETPTPSATGSAAATVRFQAAAGDLV